MESTLLSHQTPDLRQRLKTMTQDYRQRSNPHQVSDLQLHLKVLTCLDELEETIRYSNYSPI